MIDYVLLGVVQGLTELLPVSSSGHLVIVQRLLGVENPALVVDIMLHVGTLLAVVWALRRELVRIVVGLAGRDPHGRRLFGWLVLATLPAVAIGPLLADHIEHAFGAPRLAAVMLLVTGALLLTTRAVRRSDQPLGGRRAFWMGLAQVAAMFPGISRSGTTIATGIWSGLDRREAARFSFLMLIPAVFGAALFEAVDVDAATLAQIDVPAAAAGFVASFLAGLVAIHLLLRLVDRNRFEWFGIYCVLAGVLTFGLLSSGV